MKSNLQHIFLVALIVSISVRAELSPLPDSVLERTTAQAGVELDLDIQARIESVKYEDADGVNGTPGVLALKGLSIGNSKSPVTADKVRSEIPFEDDELARIHNVFIEADADLGMMINIEQLGDDQGNGMDIIIRQLVLGDESRSAGALLFEDVTNFIQDENVNKTNGTFGLQLTSPDDGLNTLNGNFFPFQSQIMTTGSGASTLFPTTSSFDLPEINSGMMTINAAFVLHMKKLAWIDDGGEFGFADLMIYDGQDTNGDGIDDLIGPARLSNMTIETVDYHTSEGQQVQAMHFGNVDFKADIAINSIYVGDPNLSLGSLLIKGLDTSGTEMWIYSH